MDHLCLRVSYIVLVSLIGLPGGSCHDHLSDGSCRFTYTQQPLQKLTCTPQGDRLTLSCEVKASGEAEFKVVWFALFLNGDSFLQKELFTEFQYCNITEHEMKLGDELTHVFLSYLNLSHPFLENLSGVFCQIKLIEDDSFLQQSQTMTLTSSPPSLSECTIPHLVNTTPQCVYESSQNQVGVYITTASSSPEELSLALYIVLGIIGVFVVLIVILSVVIVLLYRRKCGHVEIRTADERSGTNPYGGFTKDRSLGEDQTEAASKSLLRKLASSSFPSSHTPADLQPNPPKPASTPAESPHIVEDKAETIAHNRQISKSDVGDSMNAGASVQHTESEHSTKMRREERVKFKILDPCYQGDYERSPSYQCAKVPADKYSGYYERDPNYMTQFAAKQISFDPSIPHRIPRPQEVLESRHAATRRDKYRGDYERCETYVFPPQTSFGIKRHEEGNAEMPLLDSKYSGNYERDPTYMKHLKSAVPPTHEYTTLEPTTRESPQHYASINQERSSLTEDLSLSSTPTPSVAYLT